MPLPRWFTHAASFCMGAATAAAGILAKSQQHQAAKQKDEVSKKSEQGYPLLIPSDRIMQLLPSLPIRLFQPNNNLVIAFDARSKNPLFVMERLHNSQSQTNKPDDRAGAASRKNKRFHEEQSLLPYHRSRNQYYRNSGYDRGHLAPAADFSLNDEEMNDTFVLTNISPQLPKFNRSSWLRLEEFVRTTAKKESSRPTNETWVITGPLWLPSSVTKNDSGGERFQYSYKGIGTPPSLVAVPTHFYKVVVVMENSPKNESIRSPDSAVMGRDDSLVLKKFAAFVLPNSDNIEGVRLVDFIVRLTDLEAVTGLEFFPALLGTYINSDTNDANVIPLLKEIADALTDDVRFHANKIKEDEPNCNALVPLSDSGQLSKGRQRKIKQILRDNAPIQYQHLCKKNDACYKFLHV